MVDESAKVQEYFERIPLAFDRIYRQNRGPLGNTIERWRRRSMFERFRMTFEFCGDVRGKRILDIGCGSGRYTIELARRGANVIGVDFSRPMIELATRLAQEAGVTARCRFFVGDILQLPLEGCFEVSLAIGVFDYVRNPQPIIARMRQLTGRQMIASFPVRGHPLTAIRKLRLWLAGCPVYFYTREDVQRLCQWTGSKLTMHTLGRDYLAVIQRT